MLWCQWSHLYCGWGLQPHGGPLCTESQHLHFDAGLMSPSEGLRCNFRNFQRSEKQTSWTKSAVRPLSRAKDGSCAGDALRTFPGTKVCAPPWRTTREKQLAWVDSWSSSRFFQYLPVAVVGDRFAWRYTSFLVNNWSNWRQNIR